MAAPCGSSPMCPPVRFLWSPRATLCGPLLPWVRARRPDPPRVRCDLDVCAGRLPALHVGHEDRPGARRRRPRPRPPPRRLRGDVRLPDVGPRDHAHPAARAGLGPPVAPVLLRRPEIAEAMG